MLAGEGPVALAKIGHFATKSPDDMSVFARHFVNCVGVSAGNKVVAVQRLIDGVGVTSYHPPPPVSKMKEVTERSRGEGLSYR